MRPHPHDPAEAASEAPRRLAPGLHLVATPIGNLRDITLRALDTLRGVDLIACEDTRVTGRLCAAYGITAPLTPYHEHNAARARPLLIERLKAGARIALVSDAGTPLVSDPGYKLVGAAIAAGISVTAVPGPSAPVTALALSGLPTDRFLFAGFLPAKPAQRQKTLAVLAAVPATLLLFETAPRLAAALVDIVAILGDRPAAICRELTKFHEEVRRGMLAALAAHYQEAGPPKGELVIVIAPPAAAEAPAEEALDALLTDALAGGGSLRDAVDKIVAATGLPRRRVYARALTIGAPHRER
ncbi:MAG TPA: 16S rRNA (cytidine(1402)-2'-O)-methyltransferase [Alphaproteobacteria bacterium]|nr:16S rRNA (cytidine(1402)-2'-O)-methyltransferase [Alphaproteobacteria bacterium]